MRLPFEPIAERMVHRAGVPMSSAEIAVRLAVTEDRVKTWRKNGLDVWQADRVACRMGVLPWWLWPSWESECNTLCGVAA